LKAYRPGLSPAAYRSLLAATAEPFANPAGVEFRPVDAGAGLLNLDAALRSTVHVSSTGVALSKQDPEREVSFSNFAAEPVTLTLAAEARLGVPVELSAASLTVPANGSASVRLRKPDGVVSGDHQGTVRVTGGPVPLRLPYWMSQPTGIADSLLILDQEPATARAGALVTLMVRVLESTGLAIAGEDVKAVGVSEGLTVDSLEFLGNRYPGTYRLRVRMAPLAGVNRVAITHGEFRQVISIDAR
jgi:hypothetical protein